MIDLVGKKEKNMRILKNILRIGLDMETFFKDDNAVTKSKNGRCDIHYSPFFTDGIQFEKMGY